MAVRGWGGSVAAAIGVAAGAGAAQLGLGYGLGIIAWLPSADGSSEAAWVASLTWAAWIAASSTVAGAICAARLGTPPPDGPTGGAGSGTTLPVSLWRVALALASAVGGLVTVALVAVPARAATRADTFSPQTIAAGYAMIGVLVGLVVAIWALTSPAIATNVIATVGWLWFLAIVAVIDGVVSGHDLTGAQLGVWQITSDSSRFWFRNYFYWPGAALSLGSALVIGGLAARSAARRPYARVGAAASGGVGPLLVAVAYFQAAPRLVGIRAEQMSAHLMAPYAVIAGLAGSVLVAGLAQRADNMRRNANGASAVDPASLPTPSTGTGGPLGSRPGDVDDTDGLGPGTAEAGAADRDPGGATAPTTPRGRRRAARVSTQPSGQLDRDPTAGAADDLPSTGTGAGAGGELAGSGEPRRSAVATAQAGEPVTGPADAPLPTEVPVPGSEPVPGGERKGRGRRSR